MNQGPADPAALIGRRYRNGDFGRFESVVGCDQQRRDERAAFPLEREEMLAVAMIDLDQRGELRSREMCLGTEEAELHIVLRQAIAEAVEPSVIDRESAGCGTCA